MNKDDDADMVKKCIDILDNHVKKIVDIFKQPMLQLGRSVGEVVEVQIIDCHVCGKTARRIGDVVMCKYCRDDNM